MLWQFQIDSKGIQPHIYMYPFSPNSFLCKLPLNTEQSSLGYTVGPCWLPILNIAACQFGVDKFPPEF